MTEASQAPRSELPVSPPPERKQRRGAGAIVIKVILRFLLLTILGALVGAAFYFGVPLVYRATVVPVQQNTDAIRTLTQRVDQAETRVAHVSDALQERTAGMEGEITALQEDSAGHENALTTAENRITTVEGQIAGLNETVAAQAEVQTTLERDIQAAARQITRLGNQLGDHTTELGALETRLAESLEELQAQSEILTEGHETTLGRLALLQAAQDLIRVQLLLQEDNSGAARNGLQVVVTHLTRYAAMLPDRASEAALLAARVEALDTLIAERSFRTAPTLEALWADIADMVVPPPADGTALPELSTMTIITATEALTETDVLTGTVTPTVTPTPSP